MFAYVLLQMVFSEQLVYGLSIRYVRNSKRNKFHKCKYYIISDIGINRSLKQGSFIGGKLIKF